MGQDLACLLCLGLAGELLEQGKIKKRGEGE